MKILHLIDSGGLYGAEKMLLALVQEQESKGLNPLILSAGEEGIFEKPLEVEARRLKIPLKIWRMSPGLNLKEARKIAQWAKTQGFDVLHSHGFKFNVLMGLFGYKTDIPLVTTIHGYVHAKRFTKLWIYELFDRLALRRADRIVLVGDTMKKELPRSMKNSNKIKTITNGLSIDQVTSKAEAELPQSLSNFYESHDPVILAVGRLSPEKGFDHLIKVFSRVCSNWPSAGLLIAGEGNERESLEKLARHLCIEKSILMPGYYTNIPALMSKSTMLSIPSLTEGLPITILEALAVKLPIVASEVGEIPFVLKYGDCGLCFDRTNNQINDLESCMIDVISNERAAKNRAELGFSRLNELFSVEVMARSYLKVYEEIFPR